METLLWILFWMVGGVIVYTIVTLMYACDGWSNGDRGSALFVACLSWVTIGIVIFILIIAGIIFGSSWLAKRYLAPSLKKYEVWICKKFGK